ncbi:hypothetical protein B0T10DRAFT_553070 [Thelonectria olida]|uniref:Prolyl 4-hydroxylase alpha subunit domain-containing protein n=1 Tax=Thelonectria olida TaxID=1576542 RepID=A0A9P9AI53_9HYPO|nr:hypothetical protein B0T10DRAFT_553070 [Thelonectria olida]
MTGRKLSDPGERAATKKLKVDGDSDELCAKWCKVHPDGTYQVDETKINLSSSQSEGKDSAWMRHVIQGDILDARVYPLIFETSPSDAPDVLLFRTLSYWTRILDYADGTSNYRDLTIEQKRIVAVGVRDLYIAEMAGLLGETEKDLLQKMVQLIDQGLEELQLGGLCLSFHPSNTFSMIRFIENLDDKVGQGEAKLYAQVMNNPKLFAVFVNPADLSYHNFENVVPLDTWLESKISHQSTSDLSLSLSESRQVQSDREVFTCQLQGVARELLKELSQLDLYVSPLNKSTRGGQRFIFHSTLLSKALTRAIKSSDMLDKLATGRLNSSFEFVNYVFRCNRFNADDAHFQSHLDTPYFDSAQSHVSKYTMLINLSTGCNNPTLRVKDVCINEVEEATCLIFDQRYEHEGWPFLDGQKVFIRTELVFKDEQLGHDDSISALFNEACYMTGHSMFDQSLSSYANECFERANSFHWAVEKTATQPPMYFLKEFQGARFLTNGQTYWFLKNPELNVKECALMALLDFFNCKVGQQSFASLVSSTKVQRKYESTDDVWSSLSPPSHQAPTGFRKLQKNDVDSLIKTGPTKPLEWAFEDWDGEPEELQDFEEDGDGCCPMHSFPIFNPWKNNEVMKAYDLCCDYSRKHLFGTPFLILNEEIVINEANVEIVRDKIFIVQSKDGKRLPRINFAACWADDSIPSEFVTVGEDVPAPVLVVPPMALHESPQGYQLGLDFFRNDWVVQVDDDYTIPVPDLTERPDDENSFQTRVPDRIEGLENIFDD